MSDSARPTVLVADDEVYMRRLLEATFRKGGYDCVLCQNGEEALQAVQTANPCLIVIDVMMPGLDGLATIRRLKQDESTRQIPVVVVSAKGQALTRVQAEEAGAALFLTKPFSPTHLINEVRRLLSTV